MTENYLNPPWIDYPEDDRTDEERDEAEGRYLSRREDENEARRKGEW